MLDDGGEADLDLGNYERYLDVTLSKDNNITTGKIYRDVIEKEVSLTRLQHRARNSLTLHLWLSARETTSARLFRSFPMSPVPFKTGWSEWLESLQMRQEKKQMFALSRYARKTQNPLQGFTDLLVTSSVELLVISSLCLSSRLFDNFNSGLEQRSKLTIQTGTSYNTKYLPRLQLRANSRLSCALDQRRTEDEAHSSKHQRSSLIWSASRFHCMPL